VLNFAKTIARVPIRSANKARRDALRYRIARYTEGNLMSGPHDNDHSHSHSHDHAHDHAHDHSHDDERWKHDGVRVIPGNNLDSNVPSTAGMDRKAAINFARVGAQKLWAGTVTIRPDAKTGAHHHGHLESVIYVVKGKARMRWGEQLQFTAEAGPGDFIFVPPYVPHQEINASADEALECVLVRSDGEAVAINLDIAPVEKPETVLWVDPVHPDPAQKA
jgi:uncharacterized RmlC-like cupin family protein